MSLKDSLYHIVSCESGKAVVRLDPSSPVYAAHFPGYPITPGVILIQIATELLTYLFAPDGEQRWKVNVLCSEMFCAKMTLQYR